MGLFNGSSKRKEEPEMKDTCQFSARGGSFWRVPILFKHLSVWYFVIKNCFSGWNVGGEGAKNTNLCFICLGVVFKVLEACGFSFIFLLDYRFYVLLSILIDMKEWNIIMIVYCSLFLMILWPVIKYLNRGGGILICFRFFFSLSCNI